MNKKKTIIAGVIIGLLFLTACSSNQNVSVELPEIDRNVTVGQSIENCCLDVFDINNLDYCIFDTWEKGKNEKNRYALIYNKEPMRGGSMNVALVYFEDMDADQSNYNYLFDCPGVCVSHVIDGLNDGDSHVFGPLPIGETEEALMDVYVGYSKDGWFSVNDAMVRCEENGIITYITEHGGDVNFGDSEVAER